MVWPTGQSLSGHTPEFSIAYAVVDTTQKMIRKPAGTYSGNLPKALPCQIEAQLQLLVGASV